MTTSAVRGTGRAGAWWRAARPSWLLAAFAALALVRMLPAGYGRAALAAPALLTIPGALTLGAVLATRRLPAAAFGSLTALLSVLWTVLAALALSVAHVRITAESTYWSLLLACSALAAVAQFRLLRHQPSSDHHGGQGPVYAVAALAAGAALLAGGTYGYLHVPHPAPVGYTSIAWTGAQVNGIIPVGPSGTTLSFQISRQQPGTAQYRLTAAWAGTGAQHALAQPRTIRLGPDATVRGALTIPAPPGGCVYRITVILTAIGQSPAQSWSINADLRNSDQQQQSCGS